MDIYFKPYLFINKKLNRKLSINKMIKDEIQENRLVREKRSNFSRENSKPKIPWYYTI